MGVGTLTSTRWKWLVNGVINMTDAPSNRRSGVLPFLTGQGNRVNKTLVISGMVQWLRALILWGRHLDGRI